MYLVYLKDDKEVIDSFDDLLDAKEAISKYEEDDILDSIFTEGMYIVLDDEEGSIVDMEFI